MDRKERKDTERRDKEDRVEEGGRQREKRQKGESSYDMSVPHLVVVVNFGGRWRHCSLHQHQCVLVIPEKHRQTKHFSTSNNITGTSGGITDETVNTALLLPSNLERAAPRFTVANLKMTRQS